MKTIELTDEQAAELTNKLHQIVESDRLSVQPAYPDADRDTSQATTRTGAGTHYLH
jgi:hypothetical protein